MNLLDDNKAKDKIPVIVGGIIPEADFESLRNFGVADIFTPKDFNLLDVMKRNMDVVEKQLDLDLSKNA